MPPGHDHAYIESIKIIIDEKISFLGSAVNGRVLSLQPVLLPEWLVIGSVSFDATFFF
jgi:hypothetical protein